MSKFILEAGVAKKLVEAVAPFNNKKNSLQFVIGYKSAEDRKLASMVSISNGSAMARKGFYALLTDDAAPEGVPYRMNVKADSFISYINALLAFEENILFSIDGSELRLSVGGQASMILPLIDEVEPELPYEPAKAVLALNLETSKFLAFARKGCFVSDSSDAQGIADRLVFKATISNDKYALEGFATDKHTFATAKMELTADNMMFKPMLLANRLQEMADKLSGTDKEVLEKEIADAMEELMASKLTKFDKLKALAAARKIEQSEYTFAVLSESFGLVKSLIKGSEKFQAAVTDNYLIVLTPSVTGVFTLAASVPGFHAQIGKLVSAEPVAKVVVDTDTIRKGLALLTVSVDTSAKNVPLRLLAGDDELRLILGGNTVAAKYVEKSGAVGSVEIYLNTIKLKAVVESLDNGNAYMAFRGEQAPFEVKNASIDGESNSFAIIAPVAPPKAKGEEEDSSEETAETAVEAEEE